MTAELYFDGAFSRTLGASVGYVVVFGGEVITEGTRVSVRSSVQAELLAFIGGMMRATNMGASNLRAYGDSRVVVDIIYGNITVRKRSLYDYQRYAQRWLELNFNKWTLKWISQTQNSMAHAAALNALEAVI